MCVRVCKTSSITLEGAAAAVQPAASDGLNLTEPSSRW